MAPSFLRGQNPFKPASGGLPGPCTAVGVGVQRSPQTEWSAIQRAASRLGLGAKRRGSGCWCSLGVSSTERKKIRKLKKGVAELRRANEVLRTASGSFSAGLERTTTRCSDIRMRIVIGLGSSEPLECGPRQWVGLWQAAVIERQRRASFLIGLFMGRSQAMMMEGPPACEEIWSLRGAQNGLTDAKSGLIAGL